MERLVRMRSGIHLAGVFFQIAIGALVGIGGTNLAWAQVQQLSPPVTDSDIPNTPAQLGPGELYNPSQLSRADYLMPGVGPRPYADYAPPGFYPEDYQEAPGVSEFMPITAPAPVTAEERQKFVTRGLFPGSFLVPGSNTSFRFSGFVRLGETFDFNPIGSVDTFVTNSIPVDPVSQGQRQNMNFSARPTRLTLDSWTPTSLNDWNVHTFIQFDFFSGNPPAVGSSSNPRLRFAFVDFGYFRIGQDTTVFMDPASFPRTVDFQGPDGLVNVRQWLARVTVPLTDRLFWAAAVEQPFSDITTVGNGDSRIQDVPDITTHLRYEADLGHVQVSSILRTIGYQPAVGSATSDTGWGMNLTANYRPWAALLGSNLAGNSNPTGLERCRVLLQYGFGSGINRYIQDTSGQGLDGAVDSNGVFHTLYGQGWTVSYEHWFNEKWLINSTYSDVSVGHTDAQPGSTYAGAKYLANSLWWIPVRNMSIGIEYLYGERHNVDGQLGEARRIQSVFQYNF